MMKSPKSKAVGVPQQFVRFNVSQRAEHFLMMIAFTVLVVTGLPQKFFTEGISQAIIMGLGGIENTRLIHRAFALVFCLEAVYHMLTIGWSITRGSFRPSMVPGKKDLIDAMNAFKFCIGAECKEPMYDRYDFRQKFEYWGVVAGTAIVIVTGLILVFPAQVTQFLPGVLVPAAKEMHGGEAILAFSVIVTWHLYGAHLNPLRFPGDTTIFTGKMSRERMIEEHPIEYARIMGISVEEVEAELEGKKEPAPHPTIAQETRA